MRAVDAIRLEDGKLCEVYVERLPGIGKRFQSEGVRYRRVPNNTSGVGFGQDADFDCGGIEMFTEFRKGETPVKWKRYSKRGFPVLTSNKDRREYQAMNQHAGIPLEWIK